MVPDSPGTHRRVDLQRLRIADMVYYHPVEPRRVKDDCLHHEATIRLIPEEGDAREGVILGRATYTEVPIEYPLRGAERYGQALREREDDFEKNRWVMEALGEPFCTLHRRIVACEDEILNDAIFGFVLIQSIHVEPEYRHQGVGSHLVHGILRHSAESFSHVFVFPAPLGTDAKPSPHETEEARRIAPFLNALGFVLLKAAPLFVAQVRERDYDSPLPLPRGAVRLHDAQDP